MRTQFILSIALIFVCFGYQTSILAGDIKATGNVTPLSNYNGPKDTPTYVPDDFQLKRQPSIDQAKRSYPNARSRFLSGLPRGYRLFVTVDFHERNVDENAYVTVEKINKGYVTGIISTELQQIHMYKSGQEVVLPESEIIDWTITSPDGTEEGNYVGKFSDEYNRTHP